MATPSKQRPKRSVSGAVDGQPHGAGEVIGSAVGRGNGSGARVLSSELAYQGRVFSVTTDTVTEPGGVTSTRDVIRHNGSVVILALGLNPDDPDNEGNPTVLVERQYRHAAGKFLLELPAGRIEPGEAPLAAAKRELIEETGFRAGRWSRLVRYFASPGFLSEHMQVFLAEEIRPGVARPEPDEKITLQQIPLADLLAMIHGGKIEDGKTVLSVLLYASTMEREASSAAREASGIQAKRR